MKLMYLRYKIFFELPVKKTESKSSCPIYKMNMLNVGFT